MHTSLNKLPKVLLQTLGQTKQKDTLAAMLEVSSAAMNPNAKPKPIAVTRGIDLLLHCINPEATIDQHQWGLHSFTMHAGAWAGAWPEGLDPNKATVNDVVKLFAPEPDAAMQTPVMACFVIPGHEGQTWSVLCIFDEITKKLSSFSVVRTGEWVSGDPVTSKNEAAVAVIEPQ